MNVKVIAVLMSFVMLIASIAVLHYSHQEGDSDIEDPGYVSEDAEYWYCTSGASSDDYAAELIRVSSSSDILFIQSALEGYPLKSICEGAFDKCSSDTVVIPDTVITAEGNIFLGSKVCKVVFLGDRPEKLVLADDLKVYVLEGADGWENVNELDLYTYCGDSWSFNYYDVSGKVVVHSFISGLNIEIPESLMIDGEQYSVTEIGAESFMNTDIVSITIPNTVQRIGTRAFYGCEKLTKVAMSKSISSISDEAFRNCLTLENIYLQSVEFIGFESFRMCGSLTTLVIPDTTTKIQDGAFYICSSLESLIIGDGIHEIPARAFGYCSNLNNVKVNGCIYSVGDYSFYKCSSLTSITLSDVTVIGAFAFSECRHMRDIEIGDKISEVGSNAFNGCRMITSMYFSESLVFLGKNVFDDCRSMTDIYFTGKMPEMNDNTFSGTSDLTIHVTAKYAESWKYFVGDVVID